MATADEYAAWIVANKDKKGTPQFETVRQAYQEALSEEQQLLQEPETTMGGMTSAALRGALPVASGALAGAALAAPTGIGIVPGALAGAGAAMGAQLVADPLVAGINAILGTDYQAPSEALQGYFTKMGIQEPDTAAERIMQVISAGLSEAVGGIGAARTAAEMGGTQLTREVGEQMAQAPVEQIAAGAASAGAAGAVGEMGGGEVAQLAAGLAAGVPAGKVAGTRLETRPADLPADIAEAESLGIPVMTTDVVPPDSFAGKWLQSIGEKIPVAGTGGLRADQADQRAQAVRDLMTEYGVDTAVSASDEVMNSLLQARKSTIVQYATMKNEVIDRLNDEGFVPVDNATIAIDQAIEQLVLLKSDEFLPVIARLQDWRASIQGQTLRNLEELRKQIGESFRAPELASVRSKGQQILSSIYGPLRQDMRDFIATVGDRRDITKFEIANRRLAEEMGELDNNLFRQMLDKGEVTPEIIDRMIFSKKPSDVRQLYKNLTPEGRASAQIAILQRAARKALGVERLDLNDLQTISPEKFMSELKRLGPSVDVFFTGPDRQRVMGLLRALDLTRRAPQSVTMPKTGEQLALPVVTAYLGQLLGGTAGLVATGGLGGLARIYESKPVRDVLLKLPQTKKNSEQELELMKRLVEAVRAEQAAQERKDVDGTEI
jgi:hypothetical protein